MVFARIVLALVGCFYVILGVLVVIDPVVGTRMTDIVLPTPTAITDGRAIYGGLSVGLGIFALLAAARRVAPRDGLVLLMLINGLPVLCRVYGIAFAHAASRGTLEALVPELIVVALSVIGLAFIAGQSKAETTRQRGSA